MQTTTCIFPRHYEADSESEEGDFAKQIREQSTRIQKEIELERRLKTRAVQRAANQPTQQTLPAPDFQVQVRMVFWEIFLYGN